MKFMAGDFVFWTRKSSNGSVSTKFKAEILGYNPKTVSVRIQTGPDSHVIKHVEERYLSQIPLIPLQDRGLR